MITSVKSSKSTEYAHVIKHLQVIAVMRGKLFLIATGISTVVLAVHNLDFESWQKENDRQTSLHLQHLQKRVSRLEHEAHSDLEKSDFRDEHD